LDWKEAKEAWNKRGTWNGEPKRHAVFDRIDAILDKYIHGIER
jgi:hypothetical protein